MANIIKCDGGCGAESPDKDNFHVANSWMNLIVNFTNGNQYKWRRFRLCDTCAADKVKIDPKGGEYVSTSGFASDVLR